MPQWQENAIKICHVFGHGVLIGDTVYSNAMANADEIAAGIWGGGGAGRSSSSRAGEAERIRRSLGKPISTVGVEHFFDVFSDEVGFQVDEVAGFSVAEGGDFVSMGNDPDAEAFFKDAGHGEADSIDGDRAFVDDIPHDVGGGIDIEHIILTLAFPALDPAGAVDVAGDDMPAEPSVRRQWTFEVYQRARLHGVQVGDVPRLLQDIEPDPRRRAASRLFHDGQAASIDRNAVTDLQAPAADMDIDGQLDCAVGSAYILHRPRLFHNSGKHTAQA